MVVDPEAQLADLLELLDYRVSSQIADKSDRVNRWCVGARLGFLLVGIRWLTDRNADPRRDTEPSLRARGRERSDLEASRRGSATVGGGKQR